MQNIIFVGCMLLSTSVFSQNIQWNHILLPAEVSHVAKDSTEKTLAIFKARLFLFDSLQSVAKETGVPFLEHAYFADFRRPQEVNHLIIQFRGATRLMYYIRLFDEHGEEHVVYNYGAVRPCAPDVQTTLLTIAHTAYKVKRIEVGTFEASEHLLKIGISGEADGNKVIQELVSQRITSLCSKASYFTDKVALNAGINSPSYEVKPVISPDGRTLYFHRQNFKENIGGKKDDQDIYVSRLQANEWSTAENMQAPLNDNLPNGVASVASGETSLFLINEYLGPNQQRQGLSYSEKTISGWSFPKKIDVQNFYNRSEYIDYFISPTQNEMILAVQRDDSFGDQDLYISFFDDATSSWTEPVNMGSEINTMVSETSPFLAADGKTLYFASNGFLGYGGFDIFVSRRLDDSWTKWSFPENLGPVVNTEDDDLYYTVSAAGDQAYFVSTVNNDRNIFRIALPTIYKPEPVVLLSGIIFNQTNTRPAEAEVKIKWHDDNTNVGVAKSDPVTGQYQIILPAGGIYDYSIEKEGFKPVTGTISTLKTKNYEEKQQHFRIAGEQSASWEEIRIVLDSSTTENWEALLNDVVLFAKAFPEYKITIRGETDSTITDAPYKTAKAVQEYLTSQKLSQEKVMVSDDYAGQISLTLKTDTIVYYNEVDVPSGYVRPQKRENRDVSLMVKGKVVDARTLKPVNARMVFKTNEKVKSRSTSDPVTGNFQTLLNASTNFDIVLFIDSSELHYNYQTPDVSQYQEVSMVCLLNKTQSTSTSVEVGSGFSMNRDAASQGRWNKVLKRKKTTRELLNLLDANAQLSERFTHDLAYISAIAMGAPSLKIKLTSHAALGLKNAEQFQDAALSKFVEALKQHGVREDRIEVIKAGSSAPKHSKAKHHSNNRIVAELIF